MARRALSAVFRNGADAIRKDIIIEHAIIAGWTGRDAKALEKHIAELEALGVRRPATTPIFYRVTAARFTTDPVIDAAGANSSGEVEFALFADDGALWVGVGSDHTDRAVETYNVTVSKQMCDKPVAPEFWAFADVRPHWDRLILRSFIREGGERVLYQEGSVAAMIDPTELVDRFTGGAALANNSLMLGGTLAAKGGIRPSTTFEFELEDPVLGRRIHHEYAIVNLPVLG